MYHTPGNWKTKRKKRHICLPAPKIVNSLFKNLKITKAIFNSALLPHAFASSTWFFDVPHKEMYCHSILCSSCMWERKYIWKVCPHTVSLALLDMVSRLSSRAQQPQSTGRGCRWFHRASLWQNVTLTLTSEFYSPIITVIVLRGTWYSTHCKETWLVVFR